MKMNFEKTKGLNPEPIRVTVPASVAYDFGKLTKVTETVLGRLGCPACHSGFDIRFDIERRFVFNEKLEMIPGLQGLPGLR